MNALLSSLSSAAVLALAIVSSGNPLDAASVLSIAFASGIAGLCVSDYSRKPGGRSAAVKTAVPARLTIRRPRTSAGFTSVIIFETTCA